MTLFNGKSTRQPDINHFIDDICERLREAMEVYDKSPLGRMRFLSFIVLIFEKLIFFVCITSLVNVSGQVVEMDFEVCKAFNFIETGKINSVFDDM
jgi:hypothetical protein